MVYTNTAVQYKYMAAGFGIGYGVGKRILYHGALF